ncbi:hypothetical protein [Rhodovulum visakhapatnamense]|uniref:Long-subunit fatty acid transport protein n=1 Tax=Rhodovulum visakhapatnamense TaxID=364297 RepID=A0A4R8FD98_9RHOB|nr:hypothetical protein [Rhodovulum visakhapatnamense]TDX23784.1 long-subunit fatty acid transport protein [Rhodovulum visakhapatnamense]
MKYAVGAAVLAAVTTGPAFAGGIERSVPSVGILFEQGTYVELGFSRFSPDVSGKSRSAPGLGSGDMAPGYNSYALAFKQDLGESVDVALILDEPIGADVAYPSGTNYPYGVPSPGLANARADINSTGLTALLRYELPSNISLIGGVRALKTSGTVALPGIGSYSMTSSTETDFGYVLGIAWEKPEIAARVALTYNSSITHDFNTWEESLVNPGGSATKLETEIPQSLMLEFQTGVAADTLLFGSIRWVDWTAFEIDPTVYGQIPGITDALVSYSNDVITYNLGLGRKFNDNWSGAILVGYEKHEGDEVGNLGPTDGFRSIGLAATYTRGAMEVTGGVRYVEIGDATTSLGKFDGNDGLGFGVRVGYRF